MSDHAELISILKAPAELIRFMPMRIILRKNESGKIEGLCEESFSMGLYEHSVRIWWSGTAYSNLGTTHTIDGVADATCNAKDGDIIIDPLSEDCPVEIDWARWLSTTSKFSRRNAQFKVKEKSNE
mgnify:CR=1 FL=1